MKNTLRHLNDYQLNKKNSHHSMFYQHQFDHALNLYSKDLKAHYSCVNAIEFSNRESEHFVSGGDDRRVLVWCIDRDVLSAQKPKPKALKSYHHSNISTLAWDNENRRVLSGGNDSQVLVHDTYTGDLVDVFLHEEAIYCISVHTEQSQVFATACENGKVCLYDLRESRGDPQVLNVSTHTCSYQSCSFNPRNSNLIAISNNVIGIQLIDLRMNNKFILSYKLDELKCEQNVMSIKFNSSGTQLAALRLKLPPVLYNLHESEPIFSFEHEGFLNACTNKSCCFVGDQNQYLCSGSDDFNIYVWKIPSKDECESDTGMQQIKNAHLKLKGHRSIVNEVRYNSKFHMLMSSGIEKLIKIWSPYRLSDSIGGLLGCKDEYLPERPRYTNDDLFSFRWQNPFQNNLLTLNDELEEDPTIIAFFDNIVRREMSNWLNDEQPSEEYDDFLSSSSNTDSPSELISSLDYDDDDDSYGSSTSDESTSESRQRKKPHNRCQLPTLTTAHDYMSVLQSLDVPLNTLPTNDTISSVIIKQSHEIVEINNEELIETHTEKSAHEKVIQRLNKQKHILELTNEKEEEIVETKASTSSSTSSSSSNSKAITFKKSKNYQQRKHSSDSSCSEGDKNENLNKKKKII